MNKGKISTMDIELKLFNDLSFCWDYFETDGLTDNYIAKLKDDLASPVLLIGGGQGLVSRWLLDAGYHTHTLELHSAMATMAKKRRNVDSQVIDFIDFHSTMMFSTIIVNTGVFYPAMTAEKRVLFAKKITCFLHNKGNLALSFHVKTDFDDVVIQLGLHHNSAQLLHIWHNILLGNSIIDTLKQYHGERPELIRLLTTFKQDLLDYESQIRIAGKRYLASHSTKETETFIKESLLYVLYGLSNKEQADLLSTFEKNGLLNFKCYSKGNTMTIMLKKSTQ